MKFNLKKLMIVLTVTMLTSINFVEAKSLEECIVAAKCRDTLKTQLIDNGHKEVAEAFEGAEDEDSVKKAVKKLSFSTKLKVIVACKSNEQHLRKIIKKK